MFRNKKIIIDFRRERLQEKKEQTEYKNSILDVEDDSGEELNE